MNHNFQLVNLDTDSLTFCKPDGSAFSQEEQDSLLDEINVISPEKIRWENDGYFDAVLVVKAKNYCLKQGDKIKIKGSGLKGSQKCTALKEFTTKVIEYLLNDKENRLVELYNEYILEASSVKDIKRFGDRKTVTSSVLNPKRTNEYNILLAIKHLNLQEGDRFHTFFRKDNTLCIIDEFNGDYSQDHLYNKIYNTIKIFSTVIDIKKFPNYSLKKNKKLLENLK